MKNTIKFALVGALLAVAAPVASAADCYKVSKQATKEITAQPEQVLSIVAKQISANKGCACEIVKAAIVATEADKKLVAQILEQAIVLVPNKASLVTTCALAIAPDAHVEIMQVAAKFGDKSTGDSTASAKGGAKSGSDEKAGALEETKYNGQVYYRDPTITEAWSLTLPPGYVSGAATIITTY